MPRAPQVSSGHKPAMDLRARGTSGSLALLLGRRPAEVRILVALAHPQRWLEALGSLVSWLSDVPELSPRIQRWRRSLSAWLGGWPPDAEVWSRLGLDPGGGLALALLEPSARGESRWWFAALASHPGRLLGHLTGSPGKIDDAVPMGVTTVVAELPFGLVLHCMAQASLVQCATSPSLLRRTGAAPLWPGPTGDLVLEARWRKLRVRAGLALQAGGLQVKAHLAGGQVEDLAGLLASPGPVADPPPGGVVAAFGRVEPSRLNSVLGWIPKRHASLAPKVGRPEPIGPLVATATGPWWLALGSWGMRLEVARMGGPEPFPEPTWVSLAGELGFFVRTSPEALLVGSSASALAPNLFVAPVSRVSTGTALQGARPLASAGLWLVSTDPVEWLPVEARARVVAAIMGLGEDDRAIVAALRALATALGEVTLLARPHQGGLALEVTQRAPWAGPEPLPRLFREAWQEKWRTGGFFSPEALEMFRKKHPDSVAGKLAAGLGGLRLPPLWREAYLRALFGGVAWLRGPEVSCALLAVRLKECENAFARRMDPEAWQTLDGLRPLGQGRELAGELRAEAARSASMLVTRCDSLSGRMEQASSVEACLVLGDCGALVSCLVGVFSVLPPDPGRRP